MELKYDFASYDCQTDSSSFEPNKWSCNCDRAVFNVSISETFGTVYNLIMLVAVVGSISLFGAVLGLTYLSRRKSGNYPNLTNKVVLKYSLMLLAITGGLVHFATYSEHASLRLEYSIFLITAGASQVVYGILYVLLRQDSANLRNNFEASSDNSLTSSISSSDCINNNIDVITVTCP